MSSTVSKKSSAGKSRILPFFLLFIGVFLLFTGITLTVTSEQQTCGFVLIALGVIFLLGSFYIICWKGPHQGPFVTRVKVYHHRYSSAFTTCPIFIVSFCQIKFIQTSFFYSFRQLKEIPQLLIFLNKLLGVLHNQMTIM